MELRLTSLHANEAVPRIECNGINESGCEEAEDDDSCHPMLIELVIGPTAGGFDAGFGEFNGRHLDEFIFFGGASLFARFAGSLWRINGGVVEG